MSFEITALPPLIIVVIALFGFNLLLLVMALFRAFQNWWREESNE